MQDPALAERAWYLTHCGLLARDVAKRLGVKVPTVFRLLDAHAPVEAKREARLAKGWGEDQKHEWRVDCLRKAKSSPGAQIEVQPVQGQAPCAVRKVSVLELMPPVVNIGEAPDEPQPTEVPDLDLAPPVAEVGEDLATPEATSVPSIMFDGRAAYERLASGEQITMTQMAKEHGVTSSAVSHAIRKHITRHGLPPLDLGRGRTTIVNIGEAETMPSAPPMPLPPVEVVTQPVAVPNPDPIPAPELELAASLLVSARPGERWRLGPKGAAAMAASLGVPEADVVAAIRASAICVRNGF